MIPLLVADLNGLYYHALRHLFRNKDYLLTHCCTVEEVMKELRKKKRMSVILSNDFITRNECLPLTAITKDHTVLVVTNKTELVPLKNAEKKGVKCFVQETDFVSTIEDALKRTDGEIVYYSSTLLPTLMENKKIMRIENFTKTEMEVLKYVVCGYANRTIAMLKHVSEETIKTHRRNMNKIVQDLGFDNLTEYAFKTGLIKWNEGITTNDTTGLLVQTEVKIEKRIGRKAIQSSASNTEGAIGRKKRLTVELYEDGLEVDAIANQLLISETVVKKYLMEAGLLTGGKGFSAPSLGNEDW